MKNVKASEESDISRSDGAFSLHRGGKHYSPGLSCEYGSGGGGGGGAEGERSSQ